MGYVKKWAVMLIEVKPKQSFTKSVYLADC